MIVRYGGVAEKPIQDWIEHSETYDFGPDDNENNQTQSEQPRRDGDDADSTLRAASSGNAAKGLVFHLLIVLNGQMHVDIYNRPAFINTAPAQCYCELLIR